MSENMFEGFESMEFEELVNSPTNSNLLDSLPGSPREEMQSSVDSAEEIVSITGNTEAEEETLEESAEDDEPGAKKKKIWFNNNNDLKEDPKTGESENETETVSAENEDDECEDEDDMGSEDHDRSHSESVKRDIACWVCHLECVDFGCNLCTRAFHIVCMEDGTAGGGRDWICPVCEKVSDAECLDTATNLPEFVSEELLCSMLKRAINVCKPRISDLFHYPVNVDLFPSYPSFVVNPMDLSTLETNCAELKYSSTTAFEGDVEFIYHNSCVFNSAQSPISKLAKRALTLLNQEVELIELCPSCYANSLMSNGFVQLCPDPHEPVWAKVSGYPYWPAKVIREKSMQVEVQFFGDHDRAWIAKSKVLRMSQKIPETPKHNQLAFDISMKELKFYVENLQMMTNFSLSEHRTSFTGANKISRIQSSDKRDRLNSFDYSFEDSKIVVKKECTASDSEDNEIPAERKTSEKPSSEKKNSEKETTSQKLSGDKNAKKDIEKDILKEKEAQTQSPEVSLNDTKTPEVDREKIIIKEEPEDYAEPPKKLVTTKSFSKPQPDNIPKVSPKGSSTVSVSTTPNCSAKASQISQTQDPEVDNFDMRFHFLSNLNSSTFIRTSSNYLEKDWISDSEENCTNHVSTAELNRIVDTVHQRFSTTVRANKLPFGDQIRKSPHIVPAPLKLIPNSSANRFPPSIRPPHSSVPALHPNGFPRNPGNPYDFMDNPGAILPPANMLNMQIQRTLQPISPILTPTDPPVPFLPPEIQLASHPPMIPFSSANKETFQYQSVTPVNKIPLPPQPNFGGSNSGEMITFNPQRKRLSDEPLGKFLESSSSSIPASNRPRLEVKGTPNVEAQMQGSITEAKIVDKVTEKLSDSLQTMVESFLSNRMMGSRGSSESKSQSNRKTSTSDQTEDQNESSENAAETSREHELLSRIEHLEGELEEVKRQRKEEVLEVKNCYEYLLAEVKLSTEQAFKHETQALLQDAIEECKSRQWCAICRKEAFYSCCWNVSYCSTECQKLHWADHSAVCTHINNNISSSSAIPQPQQHQQQQGPSIQYPNITFAIPTVTTPSSQNIKNPSNLIHLPPSSLSQSVADQPPAVCFLQSPFNQSDCPSLIQSPSKSNPQKSPTSQQVTQSGPQRVKTPIFNSQQKLTPKIQNVVSLAHPR